MTIYYSYNEDELLKTIKNKKEFKIKLPNHNISNIYNPLYDRRTFIENDIVIFKCNLKIMVGQVDSLASERVKKSKVYRIFSIPRTVGYSTTPKLYRIKTVNILCGLTKEKK